MLEVRSGPRDPSGVMKLPVLCALLAAPIPARGVPAAQAGCAPALTDLQGAQAQDPAVVTATGVCLGEIEQMTIGGIPVPLLEVTDTSITYQPHTDDPGFLPLIASGPSGAAVARQELYPSLVAASTGPGGTLDVELDNGADGRFVLALGFGALPVPSSIESPPTWYGALLDPAQPLLVLASGAFATSAPLALSYPVPSNPALAGLTLYLQAWCQQGAAGPGATYSFTNLGQVAL
jgi:hypothetical protein